MTLNPSKNRSCDVLIICALKDEYDQLIQVTNYRQTSWRHVDTDDHILVSEAQFCAPDKPSVRIRASWMSDMGAQPLASIVGTLLHKFNPICLAMSGICAGPRGTVNLGDVIFANRVWQYDAGKIITDEKGKTFLPEPIQHSVKPQWAQRMQSLQAGPDQSWLKARPIPYETQCDWLLVQLMQQSNSVKGSPSQLENCPDWPEVLGVLWQRGELVSGTLQLTEHGRNKAERIVLLSSNRTQPESIKCFVGSIASGSSVMQDSSIFDQIKAINRRVMGLEMEGSMIASLAESQSIPWLIAKAVTDFADHQKDDRYRTFASRASAEYLLSLIAHSSDLLLAKTTTPTVETNTTRASGPSEKNSSLYKEVPIYQGSLDGNFVKFIYENLNNIFRLEINLDDAQSLQIINFLSEENSDPTTWFSIPYDEAGTEFGFHNNDPQIHWNTRFRDSIHTEGYFKVHSCEGPRQGWMSITFHGVGKEHLLT